MLLVSRTGYFESQVCPHSWSSWLVKVLMLDWPHAHPLLCCPSAEQLHGPSCAVYWIYHYSCSWPHSCLQDTLPPGGSCFPPIYTVKALPALLEIVKTGAPLCYWWKTPRATYLGALLLTTGRSNLSFRVSDRKRAAKLILTVSSEELCSKLCFFIIINAFSFPLFVGDSRCFLFSVSPSMRVYTCTGYNQHYMYLNQGQQTMPNGLVRLYITLCLPAP